MTGQQQQQMNRQQHAQNLQLANDAAAAQQASARHMHEQQQQQMMASLSGDMDDSMGPPPQNGANGHGIPSRPGSSASNNYLMPHGNGATAGPSPQGQPQPLPNQSPAGMSISLPPPSTPMQVPKSDMTPGGTTRPFAGAPQQPQASSDAHVGSSSAFSTIVPPKVPPNLAVEGSAPSINTSVHSNNASANNDDFGDFDFSGFDEFVDFNDVGSL